MALSVILYEANKPDFDMDIRKIRYVILSSIRGAFSRLKQFAPLVVCCDNGSWRKDYFPFYKHKRRVVQNEGPVDWLEVHFMLKQLQAEFSDHMPFVTLSVEGCEGDDVICHLARKAANTERVVIYSDDKDFRQLQVYKNIFQFSHRNKEYLTEDDPAGYLATQVLKGDAGDGVPNILSPDDAFTIEGFRSIAITQKIKDAFIGNTEEEFMDILENDPKFRNVRDNLEKKNLSIEDVPKYINRNRHLVDFTFTPQVLKDEIESEFEIAQEKCRSVKGGQLYFQASGISAMNWSDFKWDAQERQEQFGLE